MFRKRPRKERGQNVRLQKQVNRLGTIQQKLLLLLLSGVALSCTQSPTKQWRIIKGAYENWKEIDKRAAERAINALYESRLIKQTVNHSGTTTLVLSENGKKRAITCQTHSMKIKAPKVWDGKWRIVIFDIPEDEREARDTLRKRLTDLGFFKLQQSVAVHPFDCKDEIDFLVEIFDIRAYVRFIIAESIDNELDVKRFFRIEQYARN